MTPSAILEHEFFNTYIKSGNFTLAKPEEFCWDIHRMHKQQTALVPRQLPTYQV
jgi:hypothetical protein